MRGSTRAFGAAHHDVYGWPSDHVILCSPQIRSAVRRMVEAPMPQVAVLAYNEIVSEVSVEAVGLIGLNG